VAVLVRSLAFVSRLRGRRVDTTLSCPWTAADTECTLTYDEKAGRYVDVRACSAFGPRASPECGKECLRLLNLDIPLPCAGYRGCPGT